MGSIRSPRTNDPFFDEAEMSSHSSLDADTNPVSNGPQGEITPPKPVTQSNVEQTTGETTQQGATVETTPMEENHNTPPTTVERNKARNVTSTPGGNRASPKPSQTNASRNYLTQSIEKMTPIIIKREYSGNVGQLCTKFKEVHGADTIQCKLVRGGTAVHLTRRLDYLNLLKYLKTYKIPYRLLEEQTKTISVVAKGIPHNTEIMEIMDDLQSKGLDPIKVTNIRARNGFPYPIFSIELPDTPENREIYKLTGISYYTVTIENRRSAAPIQCRNCQKFNHPTLQCRAPPTCRLCAGEHTARDCNLTSNEPRCCVNCFGEHAADSSNCRIRRAALRKAIDHQTPKGTPQTTNRHWPIGQSQIRPGRNYSAALQTSSTNDPTSRPGPSREPALSTQEFTQNRADRGISQDPRIHPNAQREARISSPNNNITRKGEDLQNLNNGQNEELLELRALLKEQQVQLRAQQQKLIQQQNELKSWQEKLIQQNIQLRQEQHSFNNERDRWYRNQNINSDEENDNDERPFTPRSERPYTSRGERPYSSRGERPHSGRENQKRSRKKKQKKTRKPSKDKQTQGTTNYENVPHTDCETVSTFSTQEYSGNNLIHMEGHDEHTQPEYDFIRERPSSRSRQQYSEYRIVRDPNKNNRIRNSAEDCIARVLNGLDDAWKTIMTDPVEETLPTAIVRLVGHMLGVYEYYYV